jgi:hypothetical protein
VAGLGTLIAYLDCSDSLAFDHLVLPHGLHVGGGFGMLGSVQAGAEAILGGFDLAGEEVVLIVIVAVVIVVVVLAGEAVLVRADIEGGLGNLALERVSKGEEGSEGVAGGSVSKVLLVPVHEVICDLLAVCE